jgi:hypothetical protein
VDALRIELDGVPFNALLPDEPLVQTLDALCRAVAPLSAASEASSQVDFPVGDVSVVLVRDGESVWLTSVRLAGRDAGVLLAEAQVDLSDLAAALLTAGGELLAGLDPALRRGAEARSLAAALKPLGRPGKPGADLGPGRAAPWTVRATSARTGVSLQLKVVDAQGRLGLGGPSLASLVLPGTLAVVSAGGQPLATSGRVPFLALASLVRAVEAAASGRRADWPGEPVLSLLGEDDVRIGADAAPLTLPGLAEAAHQLLLLWKAEHGAHPRRDELEARLERLLAAWSRLQGAPAALDAPAPARRGAARGKALGANVRKVHLVEQARVALPFPVTRLAWDGARLLAWGETGVAMLRGGKLVWSRPEWQVTTSGKLWLAWDGKRLLRFETARGHALWFRQGPGFEAGRLVGRLQALRLGLLQHEDGALVALDEMTGASPWRLPPLPARVMPAVDGDRLYVAVRTGLLLVARGRDGQLAFRVRAPAPLLGPPQRQGKALLLRLEDEGEDRILWLDAEAGTLRAEQGLGLREAGPLVPYRGKVAAIGRRAGRWTLVLVGPRQKPIHHELGFGGSRPQVAATPHGLLVGSDRGEAVLVDGKGARLWHVPASGEPLAVPLVPTLLRGLWLVPGERGQLLDLEAHRKVASLPRWEGLSALAVHPRGDVAMADDDGRVQVVTLQGHLRAL